jgi:hypothetical protein
MAHAMQALLPFLRGAPRTARLGGLAPAPRLARPAVPLSHHAIVQAAEQLELKFPPRSPAVYVHEGARQALERRLGLLAKQTVILSITDNRHSMIHATRRTGVLKIRLHHMFLDAPGSIVESLVRFVLYRDREASNHVGRYIDGNMFRIRSLSPKRPLRTLGDAHDLQDIFDELNAIYFGGEVDARICWGNDTPARSKGKGRTTIKLGSYTAHAQLVRVHPRLDRTFVPRWFVGFVVYHEMLHHVMPATRENGRRKLHPAEFRARERVYKQYDRAVAWEQANLDRLLA